VKIMDAANLTVLGMAGSSGPKGSSAASKPADTGGVSFEDIMAGISRGLSKGGGTEAAEKHETGVPDKAFFAPADSPLADAVKGLKTADTATKAALEALAIQNGGEIDLETLSSNDILSLLSDLGFDGKTAEEVTDILGNFGAAGASKIIPETVAVPKDLADSVIGAAKDDLALIASLLYPELYPTAEEAASDAAEFPVGINLLPQIVVGEESVAVRLPVLDIDTAEGLSLSTDEILETAEILGQLDENTLSRIQNLLQGGDISIYEAVKALSAVPASATELSSDGIVGITVNEEQFLTAESVLSRIAANNGGITVDEIAFSDTNKAILEELQSIVKEVIVDSKQTAPAVTVTIDPLLESRFRERITKAYDETDSINNPDSQLTGVSVNKNSAEKAQGFVTGAMFSEQDSTGSTGDNPDGSLDSETPLFTQNSQQRLAGHSERDTATPGILPAFAQPAIPISEIASQPAPFIGTGGEIPPEMQIGNRILEMRAENDTDGIQEMTVVLRPRELGEVAIKIVTTDGNVSVTLSAANPETAKLLDRNAAILSSQLQNGGVNVKEVLTVAPANASENMGLAFDGSGFTSEGQGNQNGGQNGGQGGRQRALGEEPLTGEIDGQFTPDDFIQRRMSLWRSV
jgi:hypothetical protein